MATNGGDIRMRAYIISAGGAFILWAILSGAVKGAVALSTVELNQLKSTIKDLNVQIARIEMKIQRNEMNRAAQN
jgi:outer membrane murein-binding lipoprotein Lpp